MTAELDHRDLEDMRQDVKAWISWKPTLVHTQQSLQRILAGELAELRDAQAQHRPIPEITSEVGDVFFSTLTLDDGKGKFNSCYEAISEYCELAGINLRSLFEQTRNKNDINYPLYFFQRTSPFTEAQDAVTCLRVFRASEKTLSALQSNWRDFEKSLSELPFMDAYDVTRKFRNFVKSWLIRILKKNKTSESTKQTVRELLDAGLWGMVPLKIPIDNPANHVILF